MDENRVCYVCCLEKPIKSFPLSSTGVRGRLCAACAAKGYRRKLRLEFLEEFGGKCFCCGETHPYFLTLEHIHGRTKVKGKSRGLPSSAELAKARSEGWPKDKYQLLCYNCNCAKGRYGACPHISGPSTDEVMARLRDEAVSRKRVDIGWKKGVPRGSPSDEHRAKLSEATKGRPKSLETRRRMVEAWHIRGSKPKFIAIAPADLKAIGVTSDMIRQIIEGKNK